TGANSYQCATCVSNGTLSVVSGALPATTLRLGGGVIDLCGATHEVENLVGSGVVSNGTLVVTGAVWPGVGDSGVLSIDSTASITLSKIGCFISEDGSCGKLEVAGSLDISGVEIVSENMDKKSDKPLTLVKAARLIGSPSMSSVDGVRVSVIDSSLRLGIKGLTIMVR
ncbi:MAG: hypothetical protein J6V88_02520, partial [Kiritimatiellae bacterium]|nr:hypothetical protein [Kiritimatiellia bacterium]